MTTPTAASRLTWLADNMPTGQTNILDRGWMANAQAAMREAVAELHAADLSASTTTEWVRVPKEPTTAMISEGHAAIDEGHKTGSFGECPGVNWGDAERCYKAMLAAAPDTARVDVERKD